MCEGTRPDNVSGMSDAEWNALPREVRIKMLADLRAWRAMGCE